MHGPRIPTQRVQLRLLLLLPAIAAACPKRAVVDEARGAGPLRGCRRLLVLLPRLLLLLLLVLLLGGVLPWLRLLLCFLAEA